MKITVVIDNAVPVMTRQPFLAEHGLSLLIEHAGKKILFDTGQSSAVVSNLALLNVLPSELDMLALSHGHHDHTGGIFHVLQRVRKQIPVYADKKVFQARYSVAGSQRRFIGLPYKQEVLTSLGAEWRFVDQPTEIIPGLWMSGRIPRNTDFEKGDSKLVTCAPDGSDCQDNFEDDTSLFYAGPRGLVVIGGCTHAGLVNTVQCGFEVTGASRLAGWIGGTHLGPVSKEQQEKTLTQLRRFDPEFVAANHCTGFTMMAALSNCFGNRFIPAFVSTVIDVEK
jgi:7,8-dihydropterin-6-yl-methyl-4-(beta-D-ribofuranosyl)aminobenzene 5'-phosphate synthase